MRAEKCQYCLQALSVGDRPSSCLNASECRARLAHRLVTDVEVMRERAAAVVDRLIPTASTERANGEASQWSTLVACAANIRALRLFP
jgi:hypothetical protein